MNRRTTDLQLERYLANALSDAERSQLELVLGQSEADAAALASMRASTQALFTTLPPPAFAHKLVPERKQFRWLGGLLAVAAAGVLFFVLPSAPSETGVKGGIGWHVEASHSHGARTLLEGATVSVGTTLSFQVASDGPSYVAVISHAPDGWWVYAPEDKTQALRVNKGMTLLPQGAQLDAQEGPETLYLISGAVPFNPEEVSESLRNGKDTSGLTFETIQFTKRRQ